MQELTGTGNVARLYKKFYILTMQELTGAGNEVIAVMFSQKSPL